MENNYYPFENLPLPYDYTDMEPYIDSKTMSIHHDKHLQTYIDNLNSVLKDNPELQKWSLVELIAKAGEIPEDIQGMVRNNAGGVYNHRLYFDMLKNPAEKQPIGKLAEAINNEFGSFDEFKDTFKGVALKIFGSGYAWLTLDSGKLRIVATPNQNNPIENHMYPILTLDVWEHAYYLKYKNLRTKYIDAWFNIINWQLADQRFRANSNHN